MDDAEKLERSVSGDDQWILEARRLCSVMRGRDAWAYGPADARLIADALKASYEEGRRDALKGEAQP